jgi:hypothetical protein
MKFMTLSSILAMVPAMTSATGVLMSVCWSNDAVQVRTMEQCCNTIGGGKHYFDGTRCVSYGGLAYRRVWKEAMEDCCYN